MARNLIFFFFIFFIFPIYKEENQSFIQERSISQFKSVFELNNDEKIQLLIEHREKVKKRARECHPDYFPEYTGQLSLSLENWECNQWDLLLYAGLSCMVSYRAGDYDTFFKRCRDVKLSQDINGKWWRGPKRVKVGTEPVNEFSRDMAMGLMAYFTTLGKLVRDDNVEDLKKRFNISIEQAQEIKDLSKDIPNQAKNWIKYIHNRGDLKMCEPESGVKGIISRCSIFQLRNSMPALLFSVFQEIGAIDTENSEFKLVKRLKKRFKKHKFSTLRTETSLTTIGYPLHIKSVENLSSFFINRFDEDQFKKLTKIYFKKDANNPWYNVLFNGPSNELIDETLKSYCPINLPSRTNYTIGQANRGGYAWQWKTQEMRWERSSGHDCVDLLNMMIADLKGTSPIPNRHEKKKECSFLTHKIGDYNDKLVCKRKIFFNKPLAKCMKNGGSTYEFKNGKFQFIDRNVQANKSQSNYCLKDKGSHYLAFDINRICPKGSRFESYWNLPQGESNYENYSPAVMPVCKKNIDFPMSRHRCFRKAGSILTDNGKTCLKNKGSFFFKRNIKEVCPFPKSKVGVKHGWEWLLCRPMFNRKITSSECSLKSSFPQEGKWCLFPKNGYFLAKEITDNLEHDSNEELKTIVQEWSSDIQVIDEYSDLNSGNMKYSLEVSWRTLSEKKGDFFEIQIFKQNKNTSDWDTVGNLLRKEVLFDREEGEIIFDEENLDDDEIGLFRVDGIQVEHKIKNEALFKAEVYLVTSNNRERVLSTNILLGRNVKVFDHSKLYPVPLKNGNLNFSGFISDHQEELQGKITIYTYNSKEILSKTVDLNQGENLFTVLHSSNLPQTGNYIFNISFFRSNTYLFSKSYPFVYLK